MNEASTTNPPRPSQQAAALMFIHAQTGLHPGSGTALGAVDLPVQRERHTQWPLIPGSTLKGILRDAYRPKDRNGSAREDWWAAFGPENSEPDKHAGALSLTDARILAFPVRSLKGVFAPESTLEGTATRRPLWQIAGGAVAIATVILAAVGLIGTLLLLTNRRVPAMFLLLVFGGVCGVIESEATRQALTGIRIGFHLPTFALPSFRWYDFMTGTLFLALPQIPLTLGNAVMAIREENNRLFADRPVTEKSVAISTGVMNVGSFLLGGVPMCHGAGGMAGHVAFGARTGGAPIILGTLLLILALFFSSSIQTLFGVFPHAVLGVILFLTGAQLALGSCNFGSSKLDRFITLATAGFALWNVGLAFVAGITLAYMARRGWLKL